MGISIRHNIDAPMVFVYRFDEAWDMDRINAELAACGTEGSPWQSTEDHPWERYTSGRARCDIGTVREYLRADKPATEFVLRRVKLPDWHSIHSLADSGKLHEAAALAIAYGLDTVKGDGAEVLAKLGRKKQEHPIDDEHVNNLRHMVGKHVWLSLGFSIISCNSAMTEEEKRPFDS
jgi:hypothetical protein